MNSKPMPLIVPRVNNLIANPKEEYNIADEATWVLPVLFKKIVEFQKNAHKGTAHSTWHAGSLEPP